MNIGSSITAGFTETLAQLTCLALPLAIAAAAFHFLERTIQRNLVRRFGWRSIMVTGWLGTPIHELSHAALCIVFRHRIHEIALFQPDAREGRLGFVRHGFNPRSLYQVVGNFFIGIAPLFGGALVLYLLAWLFFPAALAADGLGELNRQLGEGEMFAVARSLMTFAFGVIGKLFSTTNAKTWQFWLFLYLCLAVGSHLAPSSSDYQGAYKGGFLLLGLLLAGNLLSMMMGVEPGWLITTLAPVFGPVLALFSLSLALCSVVALAVTVVSRLI